MEGLREITKNRSIDGVLAGIRKAQLLDKIPKQYGNLFVRFTDYSLIS
jgi:hypothetical protein